MLVIGSDIRESKRKIIASFFKGLKYEITQGVELQPFMSLEDIIKLILEKERELKRNNTIFNYGQPEEEIIVIAPTIVTFPYDIDEKSSGDFNVHGEEYEK